MFMVPLKNLARKGLKQHLPGANELKSHLFHPIPDSKNFKGEALRSMGPVSLTVNEPVIQPYKISLHPV